MLTLDVFRNRESADFDLILVSFNKGDLYTEFSNIGTKYFLLKRKYKLDLNVILKLRKLIKNEKIDIIHTHQAFTGLYAVISSFGLKKLKLVQTFHGYQKKQLFTNLFSRILIPIFDLNLAVSYGFIKRLKRDSIFSIKMLKKFKVIYNGIDTKKFFKSEGKLKQELSISLDSILVGMIGNFVPGKDHLTLCKASKILIEKNNNLYFCFVGEKFPWYKANFDTPFLYCKQNKLLDHVFFLGKRTDINNILNSLDVFVFSSLEDTFAISLIEAMLINLPTLASDILPVKEVSENGKYSILFKTSEPNDLANKLEILLYKDFKDYIATICSREYVQNKFSIYQHLASLNQYYEKIHLLV